MGNAGKSRVMGRKAVILATVWQLVPPPRLLTNLKAWGVNTGQFALGGLLQTSRIPSSQRFASVATATTISWRSATAPRLGIPRATVPRMPML